MRGALWDNRKLSARQPVMSNEGTEEQDSPLRAVAKPTVKEGPFQAAETVPRLRSLAGNPSSVPSTHSRQLTTAHQGI